MKIRLVAVGNAPRWIDEGFAHYARRLPPATALTLEVVSPRRGQSDAQRLLAAVRGNETLVLLDQRGTALSSEELAGELAAWRQDRRDIALLIGGTEGFGAAARQQAQRVLSLSRLTFPHQLVRVLVAEQLYRASAILAGHPYHARAPDTVRSAANGR